MATEKISVTTAPPVNVTVSPVGVQGPPITPNEVVVALSSANPVVPSFGTTNVWSVSGTDVPIVLPNKPNGFQALAHITGLANIVWPGGTIVRGATTANTVWVTITKTSNRWEVLIPSDEPIAAESLRDSGWVTLVAAASINGVVTYSVGSEAVFTAPGETQCFTPFTGPKSATGIYYRRIGNQVYLRAVGVMRNSTATSQHSDFVTQLPAHIVPDSNIVFVITKCTPALTLVSSTAHMGASNATGKLRITGMSTGEIVGHHYGSDARELGPVLVSWVTAAPWPT